MVRKARVHPQAAERGVLADLAVVVQQNGWFPRPTDFRTQQNYAVLKRMHGELVQSMHYFYAWTLRGLWLAKDHPFIAEELRRVGDVFVVMLARLNQKQRDPVSVPALMTQLGWAEPNEVRRAAYMLAVEFQSAIAITQAVPGDQPCIPEQIRPQDGLWELTKEFLMTGPPSQRQAKNRAPSRAEDSALDDLLTAQPRDPKRVFVVYGRNVAAFEAMRDYLRALTLIPSDFDEVKRRMGADGWKPFHRQCHPTWSRGGRGRHRAVHAR